MSETEIIIYQDKNKKAPPSVYPINKNRFTETVTTIKKAANLSAQTNITIVVAVQKSKQYFDGDYSLQSYSTQTDLFKYEITKAIDDEILAKMKLAAEKYQKDHTIQEDKSEKITIKKALIATGILVFTIITIGFIEGLKNERHTSND